MKPSKTVMRSSWSNARRATVLAAALGFSGSVLALDSATTPSTNPVSNNEQYKSAANQAKADYKAAWAKCEEMSGTERMQCRKEAKATQQHAMKDARHSRHSANDATWSAGNAANISSDPAKGNAAARTAKKGYSTDTTMTGNSPAGTVGAQGYTGSDSRTNTRSTTTDNMGESTTGVNAMPNTGAGSVSNDTRMNTTREVKPDLNNNNRGTPIAPATR